MSGQDPRWGVILDPRKTVPVYHRTLMARRGLYTRCGRKIGYLASWLQIIHLKMFAKRCKGCFPR